MLIGLALGMVGGSRGDPSLRLHYDFLLKGGSNIGSAVRRGPVPSFSRAASGTYFDETGTLVTALSVLRSPRLRHYPGAGGVSI